MVAVVLPVGHYLGEFYTSEDAEEPASHEVRLGDEVFELSPAEYAVWGLAHGDLESLQNAKPNRAALEAEAKELGAEDPALAGLLPEVHRRLTLVEGDGIDAHEMHCGGP